MLIPTATYRIQFNSDMDFARAEHLIDYLSDLGISHIYASPIFKARSGSTHGYDIVDPNELNPELGSRQDFKHLIAALRGRQMYWLQDIVPNHMVYDGQNRMLMDVLENAGKSLFFPFFDIDWQDPVTGASRPLLAPFLSRFYGESLETGKIRLLLDADGLGVTYAGRRFPLKIDSYPRVLEPAAASLQATVGEGDAGLTRLCRTLETIRNLPAVPGDERSDLIARSKQDIYDLFTGSPEIKDCMDATLDEINGTPGDAASFDVFDELLSEQHFRLAFWKVAAEEVNYRRFLTVNAFISLRMERPSVFEEYHRLVVELVREGLISGLRVDHVDGLYDPASYLINLRTQVGDTYIVVEKILTSGETLPPVWPVEGTTGYDFLNHLNAVMCDPTGERRLSQTYISFTGTKILYEDMVRRKKRLVSDRHMPESTDILAHKAKQLADLDRYGRDLTPRGLRHALAEVMACLAVYRTYVSRHGVGDADRRYINDAVEIALGKNPDHTYELEFLRRLLLLDLGGEISEADRDRLLDFVMTLQQFTGPLMAKGLEDTVLYVYNRLLSLNEVGGRPDLFGISVSEFHDFNVRRLDTAPHSMSATSTHDTKRGEDVRARLNVLSEIPTEWESRVKAWRKINRSKKLYIGGVRIPDKNDEYFLYQTLVGAFPFEDRELPSFTRRLRRYIIKAVREAKVHTAWIKPDSQYENAFILFAGRILEPSGDNAFLADFVPFERRVAHYGMLNSLSQTLLKIAAPGVPDFYQGSELWNLSLVDPDNRRPVDFEKRMAYLRRVKEGIDSSTQKLAGELLSSASDGRVKMFLIHKVLNARKEHTHLFMNGRYVPLEVTGRHSDHVIAFARCLDGGYAIAVAPRLSTGLVGTGEFPLGRAIWEDTSIAFPEGFPWSWRNVIIGGTIQTGGTLAVGDVLERFPVGLVISEEGAS